MIRIDLRIRPIESSDMNLLTEVAIVVPGEGVTQGRGDVVEDRTDMTDRAMPDGEVEPEEEGGEGHSRVLMIVAANGEARLHNIINETELYFTLMYRAPGSITILNQGESCTLSHFLHAHSILQTLLVLCIAELRGAPIACANHNFAEEEIHTKHSPVVRIIHAVVSDYMHILPVTLLQIRS